MSYLKRDGSPTNVYPGDLELDDLDMSIEIRFEVHVYNEQGDIVGVESFDRYPSIGSIRWCILHHKNKFPAKVSVKKVYVPTWD